MNRKAIIISNPGEPEDENYCPGVLRDVANYKAFLVSAIGGLWWESEIELMSQPSALEVRRKMRALSSYDYSLVVFTGHGYHCAIRDSSILELRDGQEIDSQDLHQGTTKQTLILDCCRKTYPTTRTMGMDEMKLAKSLPNLHPADCRKYYNQRIEECENGRVVMNACDVDELAGDDSRRGGYYSSALIDTSEEWARINPVNTDDKFSILSVAKAHSSAAPKVRRLASPREQNPQIDKARTPPYFPFCIVT